MTRFVTWDTGSDNRFFIVMGRVTNQRNKDLEIIASEGGIVLIRFKVRLKPLCFVQL